MATPNIQLIDDEAGIAGALGALESEDVVGIDVERADAHRYFRRAALVQIGAGDRCVLVDAVAVDGLDALDTFLDARLAVLHAGENDLAPLRDKNVEPSRVADTAIGAAVLGLPTGLTALLEDVLDVTFDGDKNAFQRADWEARPLPDDMAAYAAQDVVHLPALWSQLHERLQATRRLSWYEQEMAAAHERAHSNDRHWKKVKGVGRLADDHKAIMRALWLRREALAREHDLAPNHLLRDDVMVEFAQDPPRTEAQLVRRAGGRRPVRRHAAALLDAVVHPPTDHDGTAGEGDEASTHPHATTPPAGIEDAPRRPIGSLEREVARELRRTRTQIAKELGIEPGVLCPGRTIEVAVAARPANGDELCAGVGLRPWQVELLATPMWATYVDALERATATTRGDERNPDASDDGA